MPMEVDINTIKSGAAVTLVAGGAVDATLQAGTAEFGKLAAGSASIGTVGLDAGAASVGTIGLDAGAASVGTVGLDAGVASIGTVGLDAGTAEIGKLAAGVASVGTVGLDAGAASIGTVGLDAGTAEIGKLAAGSAAIGSVTLGAGTAEFGKLAAGSAAIGSVTVTGSVAVTGAGGDKVYEATVAGTPTWFRKFLDSNGDGTGAINMANPYGDAKSGATFDFTGGAYEDLWTKATHNNKIGSRVRFTTVGTGATEFTSGVDYYVYPRTVDATGTFQLMTTAAAALAGTPAIAGTSDSGGTWALTAQDETFYFAATGDTAITALNITLMFDGETMAPTSFGRYPLVNPDGLVIKVAQSKDGTSITDITGELPITNNYHLVSMGANSTDQNFEGVAGGDMIKARIDFDPPLLLASGEVIQAHCQDDYGDHLTEMHMVIEGATF